MTPALRRFAAEKLLHMALSLQGDILGYRDFGGPEVDGDEEEDVTEEDQRLFLEELARDALGGGQPGVRRRALSWPTLRRMDAVTADLLAHMGIDAACALALHDALGVVREGIAIVDNDEDDGPTLVEATDAHWTVQIADGVSWSSHGILRLPGVPDTVAAAMDGQPLASLLSHPVLDVHNLRISSVTPGDGSVVYLAKLPIADLDVRAVDRRATQRHPKLAA